MVLAAALIIIAILLGLGGLIFTALKWLFILAVVFLVAGLVVGFIGRAKMRNTR